MVSSSPCLSIIDEDEKICMRKIAKQIGNAVPPKLGEHIGKSILKHLENYTILK